jgi:hypothetical protein
MTRVLYRISRGACHPRDRAWVDALFAESEAIGSVRARAAWLLGAFALSISGRLGRFAAAITPVSLACLAAAIVFAFMGITEYEGLAFEDDWYPAVSLAFVVALIGVAAFNLRRRTPEAWP